VKSLRRQIRNFFGFSRAQTNGFVGLVVIMVMVLFSEPLYRWWVSHQTQDFSRESIMLDSLTAQWESQKLENSRVPFDEEIAVSFFEFDPNTATEEDLKALGFSVGLTKRLLNYRNKGGKFRIKSDLKKLYGMDSIFYLSLIPFIELPERITYPEDGAVNAKKEIILFDLNSADTTLLQSIYGIGPVLSKRIVKYRESLGGFVSKDQLNEIYGLDSVVVNRIIKRSFLLDEFEPRKFNINTAEENELATHPYLSRKMAKAIVTYRFQHGKFQTVDDLQKIQVLEKKVFDRIYPYLTVE
jgi:competence protein ComEA